MVITELDIGGAEKAFVQIAIGLKNLGWEVEVLSLRNRGPLSEPLKTARIPVDALNCGGFWDFRSIIRLRRHLKQFAPHAILSFLHQANIAGRIAGRIAGVPVIVSGIRVADRRLSLAITERLTAHLADHFVAVSNSVAETHRKYCGIAFNRMSVILNGVDVDSIRMTPATSRDSLGLSSDDTVLLFAGRLTAQKAPLDLLRAYSELSTETRKNVKLLFVGEGPLRSALENLIHREQLSDCVRLLGWRADAVGIMKAADLLVLPSHWEGLPNVLLEARAAGLPVIAASADGVREAMSGLDTEACLYPAGDVDCLKKLLEEYLHSPQMAAGQNCDSPQVVPCKEFTWSDAIRQYHQLLTRLCESAIPPANVRKRNSKI